MSPGPKKGLLYVGSILLTGFLLWIFLREADLHRVAEEARGADRSLLLAALGLELLSVLVRTLRWGVLLKPAAGRTVSYWSLLKASVVSFTLTVVAPGRVGEVAKPVLLSRWEGLSLAAVSGTALLDRVLDLFALLLLWLVFVFFGEKGVALQAADLLATFDKISWVLLAVLIPLGLFLWWLAPRRRLYERWVRRHPKLQTSPLTRKALALFFQFASGLESFRKKRTILYLTFLSLLTWGAIGGAVWCIFEALHLGLPWGASIVCLMALSMGAAVPTPGGVGGVHKALAVALATFYALGPDETVAAGLLVHALLFFPAALWGVGYFLLGRVHFQEVRQAAQEGKTLKSPPPVG